MTKVLLNLPVELKQLYQEVLALKKRNAQLSRVDLELIFA